jgi:tRNA threonylcarbamoyl adenosine modification protein (Sua5/YciO/YrdC/YwlC family)
MTQRFVIHPDSPQKRLVRQVAEALQRDAVIVYPTDSSYALGCMIGNKAAQERIRKIRQLDENHNFTLMCRDLSELASFAYVDTSLFRFLKAYTPGPYTFILEASKEVPRRLQHPKRKTIGLRIPDNLTAQSILEELNQPMLSSTLIMPGEEMPLGDPDEIYSRLLNQIDILVDGGSLDLEPTTVVDLMEGVPNVIRKGKGDTSAF